MEKSDGMVEISSSIFEDVSCRDFGRLVDDPIPRASSTWKINQIWCFNDAFPRYILKRDVPTRWATKSDADISDRRPQVSRHQTWTADRVSYTRDIHNTRVHLIWLSSRTSPRTRHYASKNPILHLTHCLDRRDSKAQRSNLIPSKITGNTRDFRHSSWPTQSIDVKFPRESSKIRLFMPRRRRRRNLITQWCVLTIHADARLGVPVNDSQIDGLLELASIDTGLFFDAIWWSVIYSWRCQKCCPVSISWIRMGLLDKNTMMIRLTRRRLDEIDSG